MSSHVEFVDHMTDHASKIIIIYTSHHTVDIFKKSSRSTPFDLMLPHRGAGSPLAVNPISVTSVRGSSFPLNSGKNDASVYGQCTDGESL